MNSENYIVSPPDVTAMPIEGEDKRFPVRRVYCVGRNYAAHAVEMGHDPEKEPPFFFQKNPDNVVTNGLYFNYPKNSSDVHYEVELVVALGKGGENISVEDALDHIYGYGIGLDMTQRDLQSQAKKMGRPWEVGKAFEYSAPCSHIVPVSSCGHPTEGAIWLKVNGEEKQSGDLNQLIWKVPEIIAHLSSLFKLEPGDIVMTGTPAGVGPISPGDEMHGYIENVAELKLSVK